MLIRNVALNALLLFMALAFQQATGPSLAAAADPPQAQHQRRWRL